VRLLLDTNILIPVLDRKFERLSAEMRLVVGAAQDAFLASVASLWEITIKSRLGKLPHFLPLDAIPGALSDAGIEALPITAQHVLHDLEPLPPTKDPFDRLLLAQCSAEGLRLLTMDKKLAGHPLAWQATSA
jgi:PIN domain nuclease of toxin-antitoxin system